MKKLIYCALALAAGLFATSCQQENLEPVAQEGTVTFTVELPGVATKAIGDGQNVDELIYEVWKTGADGVITETSTRLYQKTLDRLSADAPRKWIVSLNLVQDQTYKVLFWAQVGKSEGHENYDTEKLTAVKYAAEITKDYSSNQEDYAAFYGTKVLDTSTPLKGETITLTRPFAQLNIGTLNTALVDEYKVEMLKSSVVVTVPTEFNVATSEVDEDAEISFALAAVPNAPATLSVSGTAYEYAAMNYVFAGESTVSSVAYTIETMITPAGATEGTPATITNTIANVPLKENYRTNIVGNLLTSSAKYEVVLDTDFQSPEFVLGEEWTQTGNYKYTVNEGASASALAEVLAHADAQAKAAATKTAGPAVTIELAGDVVWETGAGIGSTPLLPEDSPISAVVINGNGKTFTATGKGVGQVRLANGALLTFKNLKVVDLSVSYAENSWEYGYLEFGGKLAFEGCQFVNAIMVECESAEFVDCTFNSFNDNEYAVWVNEGVTSFEGCTFAGARGLKIHEAYGSEVVSVVVDGCIFGPLSKKTGIALGTLNENTIITIKNSLFDGCQAGEQGLYMYETDTDITTFTFVTENNTVVPSGDEVIEQGDGAVMVATSIGFANAIKGAEVGDVIKVAGSVVLPTSVVTSTAGALTIEGYTEDAEVAFSSTPGTADGGLNCYANDMDLVFKDIKVVSPNTGSAYAGGFGFAKSVTFINCEYVGQYRSNATTKFTNCTIDPQTSYIYTDSANVDFEGCTFNCSEGKGIQVYSDNANAEAVVTVTNCTFNAAKQGATWDGKPVTAIDINSIGGKFTVNITESRATGFPEGLVSGESLFNIKGGAENVIVTVDGAQWVDMDRWVNAEGEVLVYSADALQKALNAAAESTVIKLGADIDGDVTLVQKPDVKVTINGEDKKYDGTIKVHGNSEHYATAGLTIKNVNFETSTVYYNEKNEPSFNFIEALENGSERYSANITAEECTFTATDDAKSVAVGLQIKSSKWAKVINCTATNMHSLIQAQSCDETVMVIDCTITGKNGVAFKQVKAATVEDCTITANGTETEIGYGIRFDGNTDNYSIVVKNNNVTAVQPFIVRKMTGKNNTITLEGDNTLTTSAEYQIVITNGQDDAEYVKPTGTYTLTGADDFSVYEGKPVAQVGSTEYDSISKAIANWTNNTTLTLLTDVKLADVVTLKSTEHHILNLSTYTMTAAEKKNAIEITPTGVGTAARSCLTINADATDPGSIVAGSKACIYYKKTDGINDRLMVTINGGIFNGTISSSSNNGGQACPYFVFNGGVFNKSINLQKAMLKVTGGKFNDMFSCTGDQTAYRLISGGTFKSWTFMTADASTKFMVATEKQSNQIYNVGCYVNDEGYLVVGGPVITDFDERFAAKATNPTKWSSYLNYSSAAEHGLYYTNAELAIKKHGEANVVLK